MLDGGGLELPRELDGGVLAAQGLEVILGRVEGDVRLLREHGRKLGAEFRMCVDAGADGRAALRQAREARHDRLQAPNVGAYLRGPAAELLIESHGHRVHEMSSAGFHDTSDLLRLAFDRRQQGGRARAAACR